MRPCVLILGAGGFIGTHLRRHLAGRYGLLSVDLTRPTALIAQEGAGLEHWERTFACDLGDGAQIDELFDQLVSWLDDLAGVVHLAAHYDFKNKPDPRYDRLQEQMPGLLERLDEAMPAAAPLVYASSMAAMEPTEPGEPLEPDSPRFDGWAYPAHKHKSELILEGASLERPVAELVLAGVYSDRGELVPLFQQIDRIRRRSIEAVFYPGPTDRGLTYVHVEDTARAFGQALECLAGPPSHHRLLIGEPEPVTYRQIHDRAGEAFHGRPLPLLPIPRLVATFGAWVLGLLASLFGRRRFISSWMVRYSGEHFEFDLSQTREVLDWEPRHRLADRLDRILEMAHAHTELWLEINRQRPW